MLKNWDKYMYFVINIRIILGLCGFIFFISIGFYFFIILRNEILWVCKINVEL